MLTISNTRPEAPNVAVFGQLDDGTYAGEVVGETEVPYTRCWDNAIDQVVVYIEPDEKELQEIVKALNDGRLEFRSLQEFGGADGGSSTLPI
ncbi:MAG TPA: hypothetical protein VM406_14745 [Noviherbaspirillum sp.]|nr:hypothetical protein [Noviherbaspirillum sp.]